MADSPDIKQTDTRGQFRLQLIVGAVLAAIIGVTLLTQVWWRRDWPVVTATLSDIQTVACKRSCGGAKTLVYATVEFDRRGLSGQVPSNRVRCRVENYNIARGEERVATTMQIAVRPDSCDDWRIVTSER